MHPRTIAMFGVLLLISFAGAQEPAKDNKDKKDAATPNYYPLEVGNTWHYRVNAKGKEVSIITRIGKIENAGDKTLALLESPTVTMTEHLTQSDKGVFRHRYNGATVSPPFCLIEYPATVGAKWTGEFVVEKENVKHKYSGEVQKEETIKVPFGEFKTIRVYIQLEDKGQTVKTTYWFAKDVGFVKQKFDAAGVSLVLELEKFERKK